VTLSIVVKTMPRPIDGMAASKSRKRQ